MGRRALEAFNRQNLAPFEGFGLRGLACAAGHRPNGSALEPAACHLVERT